MYRASLAFFCSCAYDLESFTAQINNDRTEKAYMNAMRRFGEWCAVHKIGHLADVHPFRVPEEQLEARTRPGHGDPFLAPHDEGLHRREEAITLDEAFHHEL